MTRLMTTYNYMKNINKLTNSIPAKISCFIDTLRFMRLGDSSEIPNPFPIFGFRIHYSTFPSLRHLITEIFLQQHYSIPFETRAPVIFDIGSNIGIATLFYKLAYPESRIFCFEPDPDTFQILQKNINDNKVTDVTIYNYALAHHSGEALLYVPDWSDGSSSIYRQKLLVESAHIHTSSAEQSDHISEKSIKIRKCSEILDDLSLSRIHLIKIDTEGAETEIIEDIREHLDRIDNIIIEYHHSRDLLEYNALSRLIARLEEADFLIKITPTWVSTTPHPIATYLIKAAGTRSVDECGTIWMS